ncbi:MAG: dihydrofolate reductase [Bacteroidetes bacterium]|jgi:dihydrofolate reductase|nr:dihydrofolate reductase [Bacteroidota bacterium]
MLISMIAAVGENLELGASNELLWHLPDDFAWFIKHTKGKPVIMGRKTMESLGKPLKGRTNIVLTSRDEVLPGFEPAKDWEIAINLANIAIEQKQALALEAGEVVMGDPEIMIIGGGEIYKQALSFADRQYLTLVESSFDQADTFFPKWTDADWREDYRLHHGVDERHPFSFDFVILNRHAND